MKLLENELVRKYFGCEQPCYRRCLKALMDCDEQCQRFMALRVLEAMEQPIGNGDNYLVWDRTKNIVFQAQKWNDLPTEFGDIALKLPSCFQPPAKPEPCNGNCVCGGTWNGGDGKPAPWDEFGQYKPAEQVRGR